MELDPAQEDQVFLSTMPAGPAQRRHALVVVVVSIVVFLAAAPFVRVQLPPSPAFISIQESALLVISLITAVLLFGQFAILRSRAMLVLAAGYLYAAVMTVPHVLAFPGVFTRPASWAAVRRPQLGYSCSGGLDTNSPSSRTS